MNKEERILKIVWVDSFGATGGWQDISEYQPEELVITSVGIPIYEDEKMVALAPNYAKTTKYTSEQANGVMVIPRCSIRSITSCLFCQEPVSIPKQQET